MVPFLHSSPVQGETQPLKKTALNPVSSLCPCSNSASQCCPATGGELEKLHEKGKVLFQTFSVNRREGELKAMHIGLCSWGETTCPSTRGMVFPLHLSLSSLGHSVSVFAHHFPVYHYISVKKHAMSSRLWLLPWSKIRGEARFAGRGHIFY